MEATVIITILALAQFILFGIQVGSMRGKHGVKAPAHGMPLRVLMPHPDPNLQ